MMMTRWKISYDFGEGFAGSGNKFWETALGVKKCRSLRTLRLLPPTLAPVSTEK